MGCGTSSTFTPLPTSTVPVATNMVTATPTSLQPLADTGPVKRTMVYPSCWSCSFSFMPCWICFLITTLLSLVVIFIMQQLSFGREVAFDEGTVVNVHVGNSLDSNSDVKCVPAPTNVGGRVLCDNTAVRQGTGEWPDKFDVYHDGVGNICAKRIDYPKPWGLDLYLQCRVVPDSEDYTAQVWIGDTLDTHSSTKCVDVASNVICDNSAKQLGRTGQWQDTFDIYHKDGQVCAHRTDRPTSWGLNLVLQCRHGKNAPEVTFTDVHIGNTLDTHTNVKCVPDPGNVVCDNSAEQVGRDGRYKDKFNIYQHDGKICAHRTDSKGPWGLDLLLRCKNTEKVLKKAGEPCGSLPYPPFTRLGHCEAGLHCQKSSIAGAKATCQR